MMVLKNITLYEDWWCALKTALVYLNDVEEGGSTRLNRLNIDVLPKLGKLLLFENT